MSEQNLKSICPASGELISQQTVVKRYKAEYFQRRFRNLVAFSSLVPFFRYDGHVIHLGCKSLRAPAIGEPNSDSQA